MSLKTMNPFSAGVRGDSDAMNDKLENTAASGLPQGEPSRPTEGQTDATRLQSAPVNSGADSPGLYHLPNAVQRHVMRIRAARRHTETLLEAACPGHNAAEASVAVAWEKVFDYLCDNPDLEETELNTLAGIIQKLSGAFNQIKTLELKVREEERRQAEREQATQPTVKRSLDPETLSRIERELNLL